ncbi:TraB/GumN family protein [Flavobacterium okayamense]|uniref:Lipoprotein n=1 Tax=Flavobacterium okayamense TaxID=2830782 RepID=A0ABM7S7Y0_9FLAO|nr:TraB/GumN family protein [Flavobacterium okayamense]BCY29604.1 lipoprotein [Flavobacterium okayamense]
MNQIIIKVTQFVIAATLFLFSCVINAQKLDNTLLWKISGKGLEKPSYLYGTMHAVCETNIDDDVLKAFEETNQLYLEVDMDDPNLQMAMMSGIQMKNGTTISSFLNEDEVKLVDGFLQNNVGVSLKMVDSFKPSLLSSMYLPKLLDCPMKAVDMELMNISKEQNEEIFGLETIQDQLNVFDKIPYDVQVKELLKSVKSGLAKDREEIQKMLSIYKSENIEKMLSNSKEAENKMLADYEEDLLLKRNRNWIPVIEKAAKENPTFFGVGAAHLAGEEGVIKLLRKQGYTVEPIQ